MTEKQQIVTRANENQQAILITLLIENEDGAPVLDSQLALAVNMAKNVLQMTGATVSAAGSALRFDPAGNTALLTATLEPITSTPSAEETPAAVTPDDETKTENSDEPDTDAGNPSDDGDDSPVED